MTQFFIDRGGTFTDIAALVADPQLLAQCAQNSRFTVFNLPNGAGMVLHKLLSENPERYPDAALQGIRDILGLDGAAAIPLERVTGVKMGTTLATNALLERKGAPTVLVVTQGFRDAWLIGYQNRPELFALQIKKPAPLYGQILEAPERIDSQGEVLQALDEGQVRQALQRAYDCGYRSCAVALLHSYRYPRHEEQIGEIAQSIGFEQVSLSSEVSPLIKYLYRGDTALADAYLSPLLKDYLREIRRQLPGVPVGVMQSHGGLVAAEQFRGRDSLCSGPAGGLVAAVKTAQSAGFQKLITFDMGGTSTDVAHFDGEYERRWETEIAGVRLRAPSLAIETVAAGGGSILRFEGGRYQVGPESAGANPGPACYRRGGPLTVTDANLLTGKLQKAYFPSIFGPEGNLPLDSAVVREKFQQLTEEIARETGVSVSPEAAAEDFLSVALENMANAIKKISLQRGYDLADYTLSCFGGAGGQAVCALAERLGMGRVFLHPYHGVLSAYGMGLAEARLLAAQTLDLPLTAGILETLPQNFEDLRRRQLPQAEGGFWKCRLELRYPGADTTLGLDFDPDLAALRRRFEDGHRQQFGFSQPELALQIAAISLEWIEELPTPPEPVFIPDLQGGESLAPVELYTQGQWCPASVYRWQALRPEQLVTGPALILEGTGTIVLEPGWQARLGEEKDGLKPCYLLLEKTAVTGRGTLTPLLPPSATLREREKGLGDTLSAVEGDERNRSTDKSEIHPSGLPTTATPTKVDPARLEIFNNRFQFIAEEMGIVLQKTAASVNIKERLDFSCAIFDAQGELVANAPHIPVHLGAMGESVKALLRDKGAELRPGDSYLSNNPYNGGSHLPDVTVMTPLFNPTGTEILFYLASRGHQADLGGITPGSMPADSREIGEEGILFDNELLARDGVFQEQEILNRLRSGPHPARNPRQNLADFQAQMAANQRGAQGLGAMVARYGLAEVQAYMGHIQDNAAEAVRQMLLGLSSGRWQTELDNGLRLCVQIEIDRQRRSATLDFTGSFPQGDHNFNAPRAVVQAVVLYVFRTLVSRPIPLNSGCLKPLRLIIPPGSVLDPQYPTAVAAGNVETAQALADCLYGALGCLAASQGTMNNLTFGNTDFQYYETICGGSGAGPTF
ncbi:MAG: hydantoinase B/oxoprolinase family protein, partial [Cyanobacteriota bacterium]